MLVTRPPRVFDLIDNGDGVSWVPCDDRPAGADGHLSAFPALSDAEAGVSSYRTTAERRVERRKRARPRKLDVTA
jgi:hypothetical protein